MKNKSLLIAAGLMSLSLTINGAGIPNELPDPDGKPADMSKPVKVFLIMGQSNALGFGAVPGDKDGTLEHAVKSKKLYPYLVDDNGNWTVRKDVRNVRVMNFKDHVNNWLTPEGEKSIGIEIGAGHYLGHVIDAPVMMLKSCIGNRSLGWDLLPPGSESYTFDGKTEPGYRGTPEDPKGNGEKPNAGWYAGKQYDDDVDSAKQVLANLDKYYPGAKGYEVAGFFWWQGDKDMRNKAHYTRYEQNLEQLMKALRKDFNCPNAKFVFASLGQTEKGSKGGDGQILDALFSVAKKNKDAEALYTKPLSKGGSSSGHYNKNAETYMNVGEGMGKLMAQLLIDSGDAKSSGSSGASVSSGATAASTAPGGPINTDDVKMSTSRGYRIWTDINGRKLSATLLEVKNGQAVLKTGSGSTPVPLEKLSAADNEYINTQR